MKRVLCAAAAVVAAGVVGGAWARPIVTYTDRPTWSAAVGPTSFSENFSAFLVDTQFRTVPVAIGGGTIQRSGVDVTEFRNLVDVPPLAFVDNNATANASSYTNAPEGGGPGCNIRITFTTPVSAFGWETWGASSGEGVDADVVSTANVVLATIVCDNLNASFRGFRADAGEQIGSVFFHSRNLTIGTGGEGFGMDNLEGKNAGATCYPDCNLDTVLTVADFGCFQTRFIQNDPYADCTGDLAFTVADFGCFQTKFIVGCP